MENGAKIQPKSRKRFLENERLAWAPCSFSEIRPGQARPERPCKALAKPGQASRPSGEVRGEAKGRPKGGQGEAKGGQMEAKRWRRGGQGRPKGGQGATKRRPREAKGRPGEAKGG